MQAGRRIRPYLYGTMTAGRTPLILLLLGSGGLLLAALEFQYFEGLTPCPMCHVQRWPHMVVVALALLGLVVLRGRRAGLLLFLIAAALAVTSGVGVYHAGVEYALWTGPGTCSGGGGFDAGKITAGNLKDMIGAAPPARCDAIPWSLAGISMAGWNALISAAMAVFALTAGVRALGGTGR